MCRPSRYVYADVLSSAFQLVLQNQCHDYAYDADDQATEEGIPPDGVTDEQCNAERLANDACQPEQEGIDNECEQAKCQNDQRAGEELEKGAEQRINNAEDQCQPEKGNHIGPKVDARNDQHCQIQGDRIDKQTQNEFCHFISS